VGVGDGEGVASTVDSGLGNSSSGITTVEAVVAAEEAARVVEVVVTAASPQPHANRPTHMANTSVRRILTPRSAEPFRRFYPPESGRSQGWKAGPRPHPCLSPDVREIASTAHLLVHDTPTPFSYERSIKNGVLS
jgi:hypothetical protein